MGNRLTVDEAALERYVKMTTPLAMEEKAGPVGPGKLAGSAPSGLLAGKELLDGIDGLEVLRLPLGGDELVGAVVGGALVYAPCLVQLVALADCHAPQPVDPDFYVFLVHAEQHTKPDAEIDAERLANLMPSAMLRHMTNEIPAQITRAELVKAIREAAEIVDEAIPMPSNSPAIAEDRRQLRAALVPAVLHILVASGKVA